MCYACHLSVAASIIQNRNRAGKRCLIVNSLTQLNMTYQWGKFFQLGLMQLNEGIVELSGKCKNFAQVGCLIIKMLFVG